MKRGNILTSQYRPKASSVTYRGNEMCKAYKLVHKKAKEIVLLLRTLTQESEDERKRLRSDVR